MPWRFHVISMTSERSQVEAVSRSSLAIQCEGLTKILGGRRVLDSIGLTVRKGEVFGFLGPNGAGKTTTIRVLLGLSKPDGGKAFVLGARVPAPVQTLARVGSIIEQPSFYPWMTGRANLEVLLQYRCDKAAIDAALEAVNMAGAASKKVKTYSHGMRQRLGLALSICAHPELLILDEPANGLDPAGIREFRGIIRSLAAGGTTVFLSSHQLSEVERACDRVAVINQGRTVAEGTIRELGGDDTWVQVKVDDGEESRARELLATLPMQNHGAGELLVKAESGKVVSELLAAGGIFPDSVTLRSSTLEERYLSLTGEA